MSLEADPNAHTAILAAQRHESGGGNGTSYPMAPVLSDCQAKSLARGGWEEAQPKGF